MLFHTLCLTLVSVFSQCADAMLSGLAARANPEHAIRQNEYKGFPGHTIPHDAVQGFPETYPNNTKGYMMWYYRPFLYIDGRKYACVPFPVVDAEGNVSGGLYPERVTPKHENDYCTNSTGQVYARAGYHPTSGAFGIMYAWYFPQENRNRHRFHDIVV